MSRALWLWVCVILLPTITSVSAAQRTNAPRSPEQVLPDDVSGEEIYRLACAACHGNDGRGAPEAIVGFSLPLPNGHDFPDFTDCASNTVEPLADWIAVVHRGGPIRALDRHMPSFGDAITGAQIERALKHIWTFCTDPSWPRGDLNLPRAFFTEKAFPENEAVWTTGVTVSGRRAVGNELVYEHRIGARAQYEVKVPILAEQASDGGAWSRGMGDIEFAVRRAFYANLDAGSIFAAGGAVVVPSGNEDRGLGNGFWIYEPFAMWGQVIGASGFVQIHAGVEIPSNRDAGATEGFVRSALGYTFTQDNGFGRAWTPMLEVLAARPERGLTEWDVVPQLQVSLSKLQHVLLNVGVRVPLNERTSRKPEMLTYVLWDWFDGGLFDFWR